MTRALNKMRASRFSPCGVAIMLLLLPLVSFGAGIPALTVTTAPGGGQEYSLTLQILILMTVVTLLPGIVLMMTAFTRIVIVLAIMRQAIGARRRRTRC